MHYMHSLVGSEQCWSGALLNRSWATFELCCTMLAGFEQGRVCQFPPPISPINPNRKAIRNAISPKSEVTIGTQWEAIFSGDDGAGGADDAGGSLLGLDHTVRARFLCTAMSDEPLRSSRFARTHRLHSQSAFLPFVLRRRTPLTRTRCHASLAAWHLLERAAPHGLK